MERAPPGLELWGGAECSIVRIGDEYRNQLIETGHWARFSDLTAMADLGIGAIRYPILWEETAPERLCSPDFSGHDGRLDYLRKRNITVIAGLLHHGCGPRHTHLLDPVFPSLFAQYAEKVARRYPWIKWWTPINEPTTTARFSCLYGHWYPHLKRTDTAFRAVVNQCLAIKRSMEAIRKVIPDAQFLTNEDIGKTFATAPLQYQADHENERRWLTFDLLTGRVRPGHPLYEWLCKASGSAEALAELADGAGAPDMLGVDHYLTSERFLDHRVERYPGIEPGTNGRDHYVDVEAVRIAHVAKSLGPRQRLIEVWKRYRLPIAITEVHHGCTREEQVRWFHQVWRDAEAARSQGVDVRAVTLWAMFGLIDWRSLLTRREQAYDVGAFDCRAETPRRTLLADVAEKLGRNEPVDHPVLDLPGWWKRPGRTHARPRYDRLSKHAAQRARPILITGGTGTLGRAFARICAHRGLAHVLTGRADLDVTDPQSIAAAIDRYKPWAVINAAGFVRTWEAQERFEECLAVNAFGPELLGQACKAAGLPFVTFSSDLVFDGTLGRPYVESDSPAPACAYGKSKAEAERRLADIDCDALIIRTSAFFGPWDRFNFLFGAIEKLRRGETVVASDRAIVSPTYVPDLAHAALDLLIDGEHGVWHLANQGAVSWHALAKDVAVAAGLDHHAIRVDTSTDGEKRLDTSLTSDRGLLLRPLDHALTDFLNHSEPLRQLV